MIAFLRFVLIAILVIYVLGFISRFLLRLYVKKMGKRYGWNTQEDEKRPEGEVKVTQSPRSNKKVDDSLGEYVDYEEVNPDK
jgi:hypothetical protein